MKFERVEGENFGFKIELVSITQNRSQCLPRESAPRT